MRLDEVPLTPQQMIRQHPRHHATRPRHRVPAGACSHGAHGTRTWMAVIVGAAVLGFGSFATPLSAAAQWVEAPRTGWVQASLYHHDTRDEFNFQGVRRDIRNNGHAVATSLFLTSAVGIASGVDAWLQLPYHRIEYTDFGGDRLRSGVGDLRAYLRVAPLSYFGSTFPFALRGGVKLPIGDFPLDAEIIPLGEGQRDWEVIAEVGHSFYPASVYLMGWIGYRWREENFERRQDFGDEAFFLAAVGGMAGPVGYKVVVEGWDGEAPVLEGIRLENASREMLHIIPTVSYGVGRGALEGGVRVPLGGQNLPAGPAIVFGYFFRVGGAGA